MLLRQAAGSTKNDMKNHGFHMRVIGFGQFRDAQSAPKASVFDLLNVVMGPDVRPEDSGRSPAMHFIQIRRLADHNRRCERLWRKPIA